MTGVLKVVAVDGGWTVSIDGELGGFRVFDSRERAQAAVDRWEPTLIRKHDGERNRQ